MKVRIEIDTKTFVRFWLVVIGFGLAGMMIYASRQALLIIGVALFLALALNFPVKKLASLLPGKSRLGGTALAFTSLIIILAAVVWLVVPPIVQQSAKFASTIPSLVDQANDQWSGLAKFIDDNGLREQVDSTLENIKHEASNYATKIGSNILSSVTSLASSIAAIFLIVVLAFLMLLEGPDWMRRIWSLYNDQQKMEHHKKLADKTYGVVTGYINGQLTVSGIGALVAGLIVFILSFIFAEIDANLAMPTILLTFILTLIPMFGATLAGAMMTLILALNSVTAAIVYLVFFIIYQQIENNFISPVIQSKKVELSALMVLVAVTIGIYVSGLIGGVIAIPIAGTIKVFLDDYLERAKVSRTENTKAYNKIVRKIKKSAE